MESKIPKLLLNLYTCSIGPTGYRVWVTPPGRNNNIPLTEKESVDIPIEDEIAMKLPLSEWNRFCENLNNHIVVLHACQKYPHIHEQYRNLLATVSILP